MLGLWLAARPIRQHPLDRVFLTRTTWSTETVTETEKETETVTETETEIEIEIETLFPRHRRWL